MYLGDKCNWNPKLNMTESDKAHFWLREDQHDPRPKTPMLATSFTEDALWAYAASADQVKVPVSKGIDFRLLNGRVYISATAFLILDEEEPKKREQFFRQAVGELLMSWDEKYSAHQDKWTANLEYLRSLEIESASWSEICEYLKKAYEIQREHWIDHFLFMYPVHATYVAFEEFCGQFGISEQELLRFLQGFDNMMLETDQEMWRLAKMAGQSDIADVFIQREGDLTANLEQSEKGKEWLRAFDRFLDRFGARTASADFEYVHPSWREDPAPVLETIKTYVMQGEYDFEGRWESLRDDREKSIAAALKKLPGDQEREQFEQMLSACQKTYAFNEDHNFYIEQGTFVGMREIFLAIGQRLVKIGIIENPDDTIFMTRNELLILVQDLSENEDVAVMINNHLFRSLVAARRKEWEEACSEAKSPLFIGMPPPGMKDPIGMKVFGITPRLFQPPAEEAEGRLEGFPGSSGVVEGTARVISDAKEFGLVQPGDILVCPYTAPAWTPLFSKIKAIVADTGGMLTHAAICAREYGIPAVVGTWEATSRIKNGQRIKVDGDKGIVHLL